MPEPVNSKVVYAEICKAHDGISEFRAKLLALLPIASGGGIFLLLSDKLSDESKTHLLPIGIFGGLIVIGLFIHELSGIHKCKAFIQIGKSLEENVGKGSFTCMEKKKFYGVTCAALIIYPVVIGGWSYIACLGTTEFAASAWEISVLVAAAFFAVGGIVRVWQNRTDGPSPPSNA